MNDPVLLVKRETRWVCPNCTATDVTYHPEPHLRFHRCAALAGMEAPFVHEGVRCKVTAVEREDYVNGEDVRYDADGRPIMAVRTERADGCDVAIFAPCAHADARALEVV